MKNLKKGVAIVLIFLIIWPKFLISASNNNNENEDKYEKIRVSDFLPLSLEENEFEREEFRLKAEAFKEDYMLLIPKTEDNYEVALAYSDGSYSFVESADTIEDAIEKAENIPVTNSKDVVLPSVVNKMGQVVYSTKSMARAWVHFNGVPDQTTLHTSKVYSDSGLKNEYTYINHGYISDIPLIEDKGQVAKVLVSGYIGWMNKDLTAAQSDLLVVPMNQVTNPSYYKVEGGILYHFISTSLDSPNNKGTTQCVGQAPSFMKEGSKYFSYDGVYFYNYDETNRVKGLEELTYDLQQGNKNNSINKDNPYYSYYNNLPFRTKTNYTAEEINKYIDNNTKENSKLRGIGSALIEGQDKYGVNPLLALGVAINESGGGLSAIAQEKNNLFGIKANDINPGEDAQAFATPSASVIEFAKNYISLAYSNPKDNRYYGGYLGNKNLGANVKYASDPYWGEKASSNAFKIDYELSKKDLLHMNDYDNYLLAKCESSNEVKDTNGKLLYGIGMAGTGGQSHASIVALSSGTKLKINDRISYEMNPERIVSISEDFTGVYDWNTKGYISIDKTVFLNEGRNRYLPEDINQDYVINIVDLTFVCSLYNLKSGEKGWNKNADINKDNIIDIYDIVKVANKIN